jgi:Domain of unknown function (DUF4440)
MNPAATHLPEIERARLRALVAADIAAAEPLHADEYQLITPTGSELTKDDYLGAISAGQLRYRTFEPVSDIAVFGEAPVAVVRYQARISLDEGPGMLCWHTTAAEALTIRSSHARRSLARRTPPVPPRRHRARRLH